MEKKFLDGGYSGPELLECKEKALALDRASILANHRKRRGSTESEVDILTFLINHAPKMAKFIRGFLGSNKDLLHSLIRDTEIIISEQRNPDTASLLFAKSGFSSVPPVPKENQRCNAICCRLCNNLITEKCVYTNGLKEKLDFTLDCRSSNCIYLPVCRHFSTREFHFGQTTYALHLRFNGHRSCFKTEKSKFNDSALSYHVYTSHLESFGE
jgi:hypothetical protein